MLWDVVRVFPGCFLHHVFEPLRWLFREEGAACTISLHWTIVLKFIALSLAKVCLINKYYHWSYYYLFSFKCLTCPGLVILLQMKESHGKTRSRQRFQRRFTTWWRHLTAPLIKMGVQCLTSRQMTQQPCFPFIAWSEIVSPLQKWCRSLVWLHSGTRS